MIPGGSESTATVCSAQERVPLCKTWRLYHPSQCVDPGETAGNELSSWWTVDPDENSVFFLTLGGSTGNAGHSGSQSRLASYAIKFCICISKISEAMVYLKLSKINKYRLEILSTWICSSWNHSYIPNHYCTRWKMPLWCFHPSELIGSLRETQGSCIWAFYGCLGWSLILLISWPGF